MKDYQHFSLNEFRRFVEAFEIGGFRSDAFCDAFTLLEGASEYVILDKYDSMPNSVQLKHRNAARKAVHDHIKGNPYYIEDNFCGLYD